MADTSVTDQLNTSSTTTSSPPAHDRRFYDESDHDDKKIVVDHKDILDKLPPGYRFCPEDYELIVNYLSCKVHGIPLPPHRIVEENIYRFNPEDLAQMYSKYGEREWYFFTSRDRKYPNGKRPKRAAGGGYWKATGADRKIYHEGKVVGYRKTLVFYKGKAQCGDKTNWIMHEYRVDNVPLRQRKGPADMILDMYILCRIYKKTDGVRARLRPRDPAVVENEDEVVDDGSEVHSELGAMIPTGHMVPTSMYSGFGLMDNLESIGPSFQMGPNTLMYPDMFDTNMNTFNVGGTRHQSLYNGSYFNNNGSYNLRSMEALGSMGLPQSTQLNPNNSKPDRSVHEWVQSMHHAHEDMYLNLNNGEP